MLKKIFSLTAAALLLFACTDDEWPAQPDWSQIPNPDEEVDDGLLKPAACTNNIVAHRGGATECKAPDNSLASLRYAIGQGCYGSECDIYWTKDDNVVVAHADGQCRINGMHPWEHTLAELRAGGGLSNGEQLPSLEDFLGEVMKEGCPTRLWLDIKNITYPSTLTEYAINAARRSCEIATEMGAKHFVEFICTGNTTVMKSAFAYAGAAGIPIGWMSNRPAGEYVGLGYSWANLSAASYMSAEAGGKGTRTLEEFEKEGVALSVFNVDRQAGDGNAVYTTEAVDYYCSAAGRFKALCTNYPAWLIEKVEAAAKVYDGIRSEADLRAFAAEVAVDPTAKRFQNAAGEVVLHTDIAVSEAWTPIAGFAGVLDGNGKTLTVNYSGSDEQAGIFATLDGTVKNLRVAGSFTTTATAKVTLGAVAGKLGEKAQIVGCTNTAGIAMNVDASGTTVIGGIFGQGAAGNVIADNTNEGRITVRRKTPGDAAAVAGVGGWAYSDVTGCVNKGEIRYSDEVSAAKAVYVGGVLGRLDIGKGYVVEGCRNEAPVTLATAQAANNLLGGIAAYANGENRDTPNTIRNCENRGDVLADAPVSDKAKTGQARMGGICGGTAVFEGNTNYGKVEARGGGKGASEFSIGGISGMIAHDATGCRNFGDVLNNTGRENLLAHTGGLFGWATLAFTITDCALDADVVSTTLYNYDGDKGTTADPAHENSSCAGILVGRIKSKIEVTVESVKIYGKLTRTINAEGQTRTIDFTTTVPADNYLYGALQDAASKLIVGQGAITCVSTAK